MFPFCPLTVPVEGLDCEGAAGDDEEEAHDKHQCPFVDVGDVAVVIVVVTASSSLLSAGF